MMKQLESITIKHNNQGPGVTLVELLLSICIFSLIILAFSSIDTFSRYHVLASDRRAKIQNDASLVLEHMAKHIGDAIGNTIRNSTVTLGNPILIWIDNPDMRNNRWDIGDRQIAYAYNPANFEVRYYPNYTDSPGYEVIASKKIMPDFGSDTSKPTYVKYDPSKNYVEVQVSACWDPEEKAAACGTADNPSVKLRNRISMPSVSTR